MVARLGNVLYRTGCGIAVLAMLSFFLAAFFVWDDGGYATIQQTEIMLYSSLVALLAWLIGRACRYVLAGR
jgi:Na+-translocating ferredoxin:NAD+ oxidoreductase RnfD subunit